MKTRFAVAACACTLALVSGAVETALARPASAATDFWRPQFHFSPAKNWTNDPNGLVYAAGEYHLFFQYNPLGDEWGHMNWGHAVSRDLTGWRQLPIALPEENGIMMFSGSAVLDARNTSGFGKGGTPPLVAIYAGHQTGLQTQNIAYSTDQGRTWTKYAGNPVIDIHEAEFRDPMVFWHEPTHCWMMVVSLAKAHKVLFYSSSDLKTWSRVGEFGPAGVQGVPNWECPSFFELPVANAQGERRWVLLIGVGDGAAVGGSATQYFTGTFDGRKFVNDNSADKVLWVDYGADFYAAQTWENIPPADGRRIMLAWMNNWKYAARLPTSPWRGQMSYPRALELRQTREGIRLAQNPVREIEAIRGERVHLSEQSLADANASLARGAWADTLEIEATLRLNGSADAGLELRKGAGHGTRVGYDAGKGAVYVDRTRSGLAAIHPEFARRHEAPLALTGGLLRLHILVDRCSVEVFAEGGRMALTDLIFPDPGDRGIGLYDGGGQGSVVSLDVWNLKKPARDHN